MLRDRGFGPTLLVSPLLALMRNQIAAAEKMGVRAVTINSSNTSDWDRLIEGLERGESDLLLISPERLANQRFRRDVLPVVGGRSGLLVIDEAHCISDWGHDFRPDYQRLVRVLDLLPPGAPVLCCTATANDRVVNDVTSQLGSEFAAVRGPLGREGLELHALALPEPARRLSWLAEVVPSLAGTGIIYCLTVSDTERVALWLQQRGVDAVSYSGATDNDRRQDIEQRLLDNQVKVVVATSALGMGFDKPDLAFVIHYQSPGSPIAYYQQVGRAGRGLTQSFGILLSGAEDSSIQDYFVRTAFPAQVDAERVVDLLESATAPISRNALMEAVNMRVKALDLLLKSLEVDGAIERDGRGWVRTLRPWKFDLDRVQSVTALRRSEQQQMVDYRTSAGCRMQLLRNYLDDDTGGPCGICDTCSTQSFERDLPPELVQQAVNFLRGRTISIEPRKQVVGGAKIPVDERAEPGRALCIWSDGGWGDLVRDNKNMASHFDDRLVRAAAQLVPLWNPDPAPEWVTYVPSQRHPELVPDFARRLASTLGLPCMAAVSKVRETAQQKTMQNSMQQHSNVSGAFAAIEELRSGPVLLVDDTVDSRWTLTEVARVLRRAGTGPVLPLVLADTAGRSS